MSHGPRVSVPVRRATLAGPVAAAQPQRPAPGPGQPVTSAQMNSTAGRPLPEGVRARMEAAFGADFTGVTVREDGAAAAIDAAAFTRGETITFRPGLYDRYGLHNPEGLELIAHELAHVLQQRAGRVPGTGVTEDPALESEAEEAGRRAAHGEPVPAPAPGQADLPVALAGATTEPGAAGAAPALGSAVQPNGWAKFKKLFGRGSRPEPTLEQLHQRSGELRTAASRAVRDPAQRDALLRDWQRVENEIAARDPGYLSSIMMSAEEIGTGSVSPAQAPGGGGSPYGPVSPRPQPPWKREHYPIPANLPEVSSGGGESPYGVWGPAPTLSPRGGPPPAPRQNVNRNGPPAPIGALASEVATEAKRKGRYGGR